MMTIKLIDPELNDLLQAGSLWDMSHMDNIVTMKDNPGYFTGSVRTGYSQRAQ